MMILMIHATLWVNHILTALIVKLHIYSVVYLFFLIGAVQELYIYHIAFSSALIIYITHLSAPLSSNKAVRQYKKPVQTLCSKK